MGRNYREINCTFLHGKDNLRSLEQSSSPTSSLERGELAALGDRRPSLARGPGLIELEVKSFYNFLVQKGEKPVPLFK